MKTYRENYQNVKTPATHSIVGVGCVAVVIAAASLWLVLREGPVNHHRPLPRVSDNSIVFHGEILPELIIQQKAHDVSPWLNQVNRQTETDPS